MRPGDDSGDNCGVSGSCSALGRDGVGLLGVGGSEVVDRRRRRLVAPPCSSGLRWYGSCGRTLPAMNPGSRGRIGTEHRHGAQRRSVQTASSQKRSNPTGNDKRSRTDWAVNVAASSTLGSTSGEIGPRTAQNGSGTTVTTGRGWSWKLESRSGRLLRPRAGRNSGVTHGGSVGAIDSDRPYGC